MKFIDAQPGTLKGITLILEDAITEIVDNTTYRHKLQRHQQEVLEAGVSIAMEEAIANIQKEVQECLTAFQENK